MPRERTIITINKYIEDEEKKLRFLFCFVFILTQVPRHKLEDSKSSDFRKNWT